MPKFLSAKSSTRETAKTGIVISNRIDETNKAHAVSGILVSFKLPPLDHKMVVTKFTATKSDDTQAKQTAIITKSTAIPSWYILPESGGYNVQPVATPRSECAPNVTSEERATPNEVAKIQNDMYPIFGKANESVLSNLGKVKLPNPLINIGINM